MEHRYMSLERSLCKELTALEEKYRNGQEMSEGDLRRIDLLAHSMKSLMGYIKMSKENGQYEEQEYRGNQNGYPQNNSYAMNSYDNSYNTSYDNTYRDSRYRQDMHYPPMQYPDRRW